MGSFTQDDRDNVPELLDSEFVFVLHGYSDQREWEMVLGEEDGDDVKWWMGQVAEKAMVV